MHTTIRLITTALLALALTAPIASAAPVSPYPPPPWVQSIQQDGHKKTLAHSKRHHAAPVAIPPVQGYPYTAEQLKPLKAPQQPAPATDDGPSPSVFIIASVVLIALLGAGIALVKVSRSGRVTPTSA